jgi:hypothetical protein
MMENIDDFVKSSFSRLMGEREMNWKENERRVKQRQGV